MRACMLSGSIVYNIATPWDLICQAPLFTEFSWQEYWSGFLCPSPGDLPHPGIKPKSPVFPALAGKFCASVPPRTLVCQKYILFSDSITGYYKILNIAIPLLYSRSLMFIYFIYGNQYQIITNRCGTRG